MKKTLISISLVLLMTVSFAQNQISELQKGLIAHFPLSEWYPATDLVSETTGTPTDVYNVLDRQGSGRRYIDNVNAGYASLADDARYDFGTGDFTLIASFTPANITDNGKYLISKEAGGIGYGLYQQGNDLYVRIDDNTTDASGIIGTDILVAGTKITCEVVFNRAGNAVLYLNGSASSSGTLAISTASLTLDNTGAFVVGNVEAHNAGFTGQIHFIRAFNFALTTQIANYSKPSYPIEATHRGAGATKNVLDLNSEGLTAAGHWYDKTNTLDATVSGATVVIPPAGCLGATWFNGTSGKIDFPDNNNLTPPSEFTFSMWIMPNSLPGYRTPIRKAGEYLFYLSAGGVLDIYLYSNGGGYSYYHGTTTLAINTWYHVAFSYIGGVGSIYVNGAKEATSVTSGAGGFSGFTNTSAVLNVGTGTTDYFIGALANFSIHTGLYQDQIKLLYDLGH